MTRIRQFLCSILGHFYESTGLYFRDRPIPVEMCTYCGLVRCVQGARVVAWDDDIA